MKSLSDEVADRFITRSVNLLRFDAGLRIRIATMLGRLERELVTDIARFNPYEPQRTAFQRARLDALLKQTRETILTGYRGMRVESEGDLRELAVAESQSVYRSINQAVGMDLLTVGVSEVQLKSIVGDAMIEGSPTRQWWGRQARDLERRFADQMRLGMLRGETVDELTRRVRGTRANGYADGIMQASRRQAAALVRSSVQAVANGARMETFQANDDVVRGVQALVTLDGATTDICIARSGSAWLLDGSPFKDSPRQEPFPGYPPWHWQCRTTLTAVLYSFEDMLGEVGTRKESRLRELPTSTQSSMDGQVAADLTYPQWLAGKDKAFQISVLGRGRWQLWQDGQLSLPDMIDQGGRPLSLRELQEA